MNKAPKLERTTWLRVEVIADTIGERTHFIEWCNKQNFRQIKLIATNGETFTIDFDPPGSILAKDTE
jgi:hypothetical protein